MSVFKTGVFRLCNYIIWCHSKISKQCLFPVKKITWPKNLKISIEERNKGLIIKSLHKKESNFPFLFILMMAEKFPDIIEENVIWLDYTFPTQFFKIRFIFALVSLKRQFIFHPTVLNSTNLLVNLILVTTSLFVKSWISPKNNYF